ncbi:MAG TPA: hypothetical protein VMR74_05400 [Gammaproteobacteria bacterium]|nr:hypothetical protein [Gammaproteobacteria bacterium]
MTGASHKRSIVVWDLPSAVVGGTTFTIKLGIKCESLCRPENWSLDVRNREGRRLASVAVGATAWPGTEALYGAELELAAPAAEGLYRYEVIAAADAYAGRAPPDNDSAHDQPPPGESAAAPHDAVTAGFNVRAVPEAHYRLTVIAIERRSQAPVQGAKVVVHPYRALTDEHGVAELDLPQGRYRVFVSGRDCFPLRLDGELAANTTLRAELELEPGPSDAELWA